MERADFDPRDGRPTLRPMTESTTHGDARRLHRLILERIRQDVVGLDQAVERVALVACLHGIGVPRQRVTLIGPSGVGKTTLCRAVAHALELPFVVVDVASITETGFHGTDLHDVLIPMLLKAKPRERADRAVVVLDEIDKLAIAGRIGVGIEHRRGKQESLLKLLEGDVLQMSSESGGRFEWSSARALVIAAGVFAGLPSGSGPSVAPGDLIELGLMPELVERLGQVIRLSALPTEVLAEVLHRALISHAGAYEVFGYTLRVPHETLTYVARAVAANEAGAGPRSGAAWLRAAADEGLLALLRDGAPAGSTYELVPDAIHIPASSPPSRQWTDGDDPLHQPSR